MVERPFRIREVTGSMPVFSSLLFIIFQFTVFPLAWKLEPKNIILEKNVDFEIKEFLVIHFVIFADFLENFHLFVIPKVPWQLPHMSVA